MEELASPSLVGRTHGSAVRAAEKTRGRSDFVGRSSRYIQICRCAAAAQLAAAANMGAAQLFSARDSANDFTCNVAGTDGLCNSVARGSSSIARFDPVTPTAALRDAPTDGWVLWWWSAFSADHRLHAAISPPSVPTETMESAGSMLKGWDLTDLG